METPTESPHEPLRQDTASWAPLIQTLQVTGNSGGIPELVAGRRLVGPMQDFVKMWQKTYRIRLPAQSIEPSELIKVWNEEFPTFWPEGNRFYAPLVGIAPGEVALISLQAGPMKLSTGVLVVYADHESFTLLMPQGHMFAGLITFSAFEDTEHFTVQTQVFMRA